MVASWLQKDKAAERQDVGFNKITKKMYEKTPFSVFHILILALVHSYYRL